MPQLKNSPALIRFLGKHRRLFLLGLGVVAVAVHLGLLLLPGGADALQLRALENAYATRTATAHSLGRGLSPIEDILIIGFDHTFVAEDYPDLLASEPALALLGAGHSRNNPNHTTVFDRALYGLILERLAAAGARLVIFDWFFDGPGPLSDTGNAFFAGKIAQWQDRVVLGNLLQFEQRDNLATTTLRDPHAPLLPDDDDALLGFVNIWPDAHGCLSRSVQAENLLALTNPALQKQRLPPDIFSLSTRAAMKLGMPAPDDTRPKLINYAGPGGTFPKIPVQSIFIPTEWENRFGNGAYFKDKIILVGPYSEIHYKDAFRTPVGAMLGVEIQANCLNNALRQNWLGEVFPGQSALAWTALLCGAVWLVFTLPLRRTGAGQRFLIAAVLLGGWLVLRWYLFSWHDLLFPGFSLAAAAGLTVACLAFDFSRVQYERTRLRHLFGSYLAPAVVRKLIEQNGEPELGGEQVTLTGFFADVQDFTAFSEKLTPAQLVELMNEYLGAMTPLLERHEGTLDKYAGDSIVAMFGAPLPMPDHAARACACALDMQSRLAELRHRWTSRPGPWPEDVRRMRMRVGLNTGPAIVGNMGSVRRFNYTMMGDTVNLAARCESGAKAMGVFILATQATVDAAGTHDARFVFRELDKWRVPGRAAPVSVHELMGTPETLSTDTAACIRLYAEGLTRYFQRDWAAAREKFLAAAPLEPLRPGRDPGISRNPSLVMAARCADFLASPPPEDWDGTFHPAKHPA